MSQSFNAKSGPIFVKAEATGPSRSMTLQLILDTGATTSLLSETVLLAMGIDPVLSPHRVQMTKGSILRSVPRVILTRLTALGTHRFGFPVLAHTLPTSDTLHGLLGLDFLRDHSLLVDFRTGQITLRACEKICYV